MNEITGAMSLACLNPASATSASTSTLQRLCRRDGLAHSAAACWLTLDVFSDDIVDHGPTGRPVGAGSTTMTWIPGGLDNQAAGFLASFGRRSFARSNGRIPSVLNHGAVTNMLDASGIENL